MKLKIVNRISIMALTIYLYIYQSWKKSAKFRQKGANKVLKNVVNLQLIIMSKYQNMQEEQKQNLCHPEIKLNKIYRNSCQYRLGQFVFKPGISVEQIRQLVPEKLMRLVNVSPAYRYCKKQMHSIRVWLKFCTQWNHGILQLGSHGYGTFFIEFKMISLKRLLVLNLENNNIGSIECIQLLDAPNIDCIYLHGNPIVTIKSFRKANFPRLTRLYINVADNQYLSQFCSQSLNLIQNSPRTRQKFEWKKYNNIRWIAKIQSKKLRRVLTGLEKYAQNFEQLALNVLREKNRGLKIN